jgi:hypothetical protein
MIGPVDLEAPGPDLVSQVEQIFSANGTFSKSRNFEYRPQQQEMAVAVAQALTNKEHLLVEAGTGVGKSFAYLVPAILFAVDRRKKAIISTHTINLQEQLIEKDLPVLERVLPVKFNYTMLKGRQNYLCTRRLHKAMLQADGLFTSPEVQELKRIHDWSKQTKDGSLSDFEIEPDLKVWSHVCSERGLCTPKICGFQSDLARSTEFVSSSGAQPDSVSRCPGAESHAVLHLAGRSGGGTGRRNPLQERFRGVRRSAHRRAGCEQTYRPGVSSGQIRYSSSGCGIHGQRKDCSRCCARARP